MGLVAYFKTRRQRRQEKIAARSKTQRIVRAIIGTVLYIAFIVGLIIGIPAGLSKALNSQYPMAAITSSSMWPQLKKGDLVFIEGVSRWQIAVGDIVVYTNEKNAFTIHRVVKLDEDTLTTRGDANNVDDKPVRYEDIVGRLYKIGDRNARIPKLGFISTSFSKLVNRANTN